MVWEVRVYDDDFRAKNSLELDVADLDGKTELEPLVDRELNAFSKFCETTLKSGPVTPFERSILKTYLWWKTHPQA